MRSKVLTRRSIRCKVATASANARDLDGRYTLPAMATRWLRSGLMDEPPFIVYNTSRLNSEAGETGF